MARTGRNEPCPCGSGRKFKKCCLDREAQPVAREMPAAVATRLRQHLRDEEARRRRFGNVRPLITKVEKRASQGLTLLSTYTFSKTMFDSFAGNGANRLSNPFDAKSEKGLAETNQRHRVTTSVLYELPLFRA